MNQIDDRLLDYILATLKEVVDAVSDIYQKQGVSEEQLNSLREQIRKLELELSQLREGDIDRKVDKGKAEVFGDFTKTYIAPIVTAVLAAAITALYFGMQP